MSVWPAAFLGELFEIARGGSPRPIQDFLTDAADGVNWIMIGDAPEGSKFIWSTKKKIRTTGVKSSRLVQPGDFLLTNSMSFGRPYILKTTGCIHDGWLLLRPRDSRVHPDYFYHLLGSNSVYAEFSRLAAGVTVKNLNIDLVSSVGVPIPPVPEQRRVAAILDQAEALRTLRRAALAKLDQLVNSIYLEQIGDPFANSRNWPWVTMEKLFDAAPIFGTMIPATVGAGSWLCLRVANIQDWDLDLSDRKYVELPAGMIARHGVQDGDLLMARAIATQEHLGKCIVARPGTEKWAFDSHLMRLRFRADRALPEVIRQMLRTSGGRRMFLKASRKSSVQYNINTKEIASLELPLPPLNVQRAFVDRLRSIESLKAAHRASLAHLDALFASLQHRAFRG